LLSVRGRHTLVGLPGSRMSRQDPLGVDADWSEPPPVQETIALPAKFEIARKLLVTWADVARQTLSRTNAARILQPRWCMIIWLILARATRSFHFWSNEYQFFS
jgi:hypothetical protein